jgi:predicted AlkP superfamily phosphohydrolase/phosphomutase
MSKVLIIGLDGANWPVLRPYLDKGVMPNLAHLIETGVSGPLCSVVPTHSAVAWVSFMTGKNPGRHGVFDFAERSPYNRMRMTMVNSQSMRGETFLHVLGRHDRCVGAVHIPITYPPFPVNGILVSGMVVPEGATYTYPADFAAELDREAGGFPLNLMDWRYMLDRLDTLVDEATAVTRQRARVLQYVIENKRWDVLAQVFVSPDRLQHPLMHILDPAHPFYDTALAQQLGSKLDAYFAALDDILGMAGRSIPEDAVLMVISDHGFQGVHKSFDLKEILKQIGVLNTRVSLVMEQEARKRLRTWLGPIRHRLPRPQPKPHNHGSPMLMVDVDWARTRAYTTAHTSQDVVVNLKGREPDGIVAPGEEYETLLDTIRTQMLALRDPGDGKPILKDVIRASEYYHGPYVSDGPDLLIVPADGLAGSTVDQGPHLAPLRYQLGAHDLYGIFIANGAGIRAGEAIVDASLIDLAPTTLYLSDVPVPSDMDGQVLNLFTDDRLTARPPRYEAPVGQIRDEYTYSSEDERVLEEHLRGLGYL